jgi:hypothetical protein
MKSYVPRGRDATNRGQLTPAGCPDGRSGLLDDAAAVRIRTFYNRAAVLAFCFVMAKRQNHFFVDLVTALRYELDRIGVSSFVSTDGFPSLRPGLVYILFPPHEYFRLERQVPPQEVLARTIFICAEQPDTGHFIYNVELAPVAGALFDINRQSIREFAKLGIGAQHLPLGYSGYWDRGWDDRGRDVELVFLGAETPRRLKYLAAYSPVLTRHKTTLIITDNSAPNSASAPNFLVGDQKLALLRRSKVLINIHQERIPYFEWQRVVESVHSGCAVVSEHSTDFEPFVPGVHFVSGLPDSLALLAEELLEDERMRKSLQEEALTCLREQLPLRSSAVALVEAGLALDSRARPQHVRWAPPAWATERWSGREEVRQQGLGEPAPADAGASELAVLRRSVKDIQLELQDVRRELARSRALLAAGDGPPAVRTAWTAPGHRAVATPRVSIVTALYNHARWICDALNSVAASTYRDLEVLVVDDGSTDGSGDRVRAWSGANPEIPLLVLQHPLNRGLPSARNTGLDFARGEFVLVLDSDNEIFPGCLDRLVRALDGDPGAVFAYGMLATFDDTGYQGLISQFPWDPWRLRNGNYIDALALLRSGTLRELGGYTTDRRLYGWEDYDLYCRLAERGDRAVFVPEVVASYRQSPASMRTLTDVSTVSAFSALAERCPNLMRDAAFNDHWR